MVALAQWKKLKHRYGAKEHIMVNGMVKHLDEDTDTWQANMLNKILRHNFIKSLKTLSLLAEDLKRV